MGKYWLICFLVMYVFTVNGQSTPEKFVSKDSLYNENIKKSKLYGVYIPRDIDDALGKLLELTTPEAREPMKNVDEEVVAKKLHFGLGRWMEYNWNFAEGSRFSHYLRQKGIIYTDDMTRFMLILFHRQVVGHPLDVDKLVKKIVDERTKKIEEERKTYKVISTEVKLNSKN